MMQEQVVVVKILLEVVLEAAVVVPVLLVRLDQVLRLVMVVLVFPPLMEMLMCPQVMEHQDLPQEDGLLVVELVELIIVSLVVLVVLVEEDLVLHHLNHNKDKEEQLIQDPVVAVVVVRQTHIPDLSKKIHQVVPVL
jgi:hypothetical protein